MNQKTKWQQKQIGDVCEATRGTSITKKEVVDGKYPVIAGGQTPAYFHNQFNREGKTITISGSGAYAGFTAYHKTPIFASDCTTLQIPKEDNLLTKFLFLSLKSRQADIYKMQTGAAQPHVYCRDIAKMEIAFPPLAEQKRIVQILERQLETVEKARIAAEKRLSEANALSAGILRAVFSSTESKSWKCATLGDVITDMKDGGTPPRNNPENFGGNIHWAVVKDIYPEIKTTRETLTERGLNNCSAKIWPVNSVIISLGATIGNVGIAKIPLATKQGLSGIVVNNKKISYQYLYYFLLHSKQFILSLASGTTIKEIRPPKLQSALTIPLPPLAEQKRIADLLGCQLAVTEKLQTVAAAELDEINALPAAFLRAAFSAPHPAVEA